jgi:fibronectin-binding autotransporter adhesin
MLAPHVRNLVKKLTRQVVRHSAPIKDHRLNSFRPRLEALEDRTLPSIVNWIGGSGNWNDASHWDAGNVPTAADDAVINVAGVTVTHGNSGTDPVQSISVSSGTLSLTVGTLNVSGMLSGTGTFRLAGGTLANANVAMGITFTNSGTLSGVTLSADQDLAAATSSVTLTNGLSLDSASILLGNAAGSTTGMLIINGTQTLGGTGGSIVFGGSFGGSNSNLVGSPGASTLTLGPDIVLRGKNGQVNIQGFVNQGTISADTEAGTITISSTHWTNQGIIQAQNGGTILAQGTVTNFSAGTLTGGTWQVFADSTLRLVNTGIVTNAATILLDGANSNFYSDVGTTEALGNLATNAAAGSFTIQNGRAFSSAGTFTNAGTLTVGNGGTFTQSGNYDQTGSLNILVGGTANLQDGADSGTLSNDGTLDIGGGNTFTQSGTYSQTGTLNVQSGGTLTLSGTFSNYDGSGTLTGGTYQIAGTLQFANAAIVTNAANLIIAGPSAAITDLSSNDALAGLSAVTSGNSLALQNGASLTTTGTLTNAGTVSIDTTSALAVGDSFIQTGGSTTLEGTLTAPTLVDVQGGTLIGTGTITGNLQNEASILIGSDTTAGTLTVTGDFSQSSTGNLTVKVGGPGASTDFDQLVVGGAAMLDGTLTISLVNGFVPDSGTTYAVVTFASATGMFATLDGDGPLFTAGYDAMDCTLTAN